MSKEKVKKFGIDLTGDTQGFKTSWGMMPSGNSDGRDDFGLGTGENKEPIMKLGETTISDSELDSLCGKNAYDSITKISDYLYEVNYNDINYEYGEKFINELYNRGERISGACSSVRKDNMYGRNYDWTYDNSVSFIVRVPANKSRHASIGVSGSIKELTRDVVESRSFSEAYRGLPFVMMDGINDAGVVCNINVVPSGDMGITTGTNPGSPIRKCAVELIRFILDNFDSASKAAYYIKDNVDVYAPRTKTGTDECHIMIADANKTFVLEFVDVIEDGRKIHKCVVLEPYNKFMTNFYLKDATMKPDGHVDIDSVTDFAMGIERYNMIADAYESLDTSSPVGMTSLMNSLIYTKAYDSTVDPFWKTEFVGDNTSYGFGVYTVRTPQSEMQEFLDFVIENYESRSRDTGTTWQTVHSSVYDMNSKTLYVISQENTTKQSAFSILRPSPGIPSTAGLPDGDYTLKATILNGETSFSWESGD